MPPNTEGSVEIPDSPAVGAVGIPPVGAPKPGPGSPSFPPA